jgi:hypothetical protein
MLYLRVMAEASVSFSEPVSSPTTRRVYELRVADASGNPLSGLQLEVMLTGDGSFAPNFSSKEIRRETDEAGKASFDWYRRSIFNRQVNATITVGTTRDDCSIEIELIPESQAAAQQGPKVSYVQRPFKLRR